MSVHPAPRAAHADPRWAAVLARDPEAHFVYAVRTTGVYRSPASPARLPRPENVEFFESAAAAEAAGYRPSRHAAADRAALARRHRELVAEACRRIADAEEPPTLAELAAGSGLSPFHFHRVFKACTGVTPRAYAAAARADRLRESLPAAATITAAIHDAGFHANGRFYEASRAVLGMAPGAYRGGGAALDVRFAVGQCSLGAILVAATDAGVCAILLGDDAQALVHELQDRFPRANLIGGDAGFEELVARVVGLVEAPRIGIDLPLDVRGTAFQQRVWQALRAIPPGTTATYAEIAARIGAPGAVRAVARACAANPIAVAIPCHRVVRTDGGLAGYRWGVARKRDLLAREAAPEANGV